MVNAAPSVANSLKDTPMSTQPHTDTSPRSYNAPRYTCPHCSARAKFRTSRKLSSTTTEIYFQCQNYECGHTWKSYLSAVHTIVPSQLPNPAVYLRKVSRDEIASTDPRQKDLTL